MINKDQSREQIPRSYDRFDLELRVKISLLEAGRTASSDSVVLRNISGKGICFLSQKPGIYSVGRRITVDILPDKTGTEDLPLIGRGSVAWVGKKDDSGASIGVSMDDLLSSEHFIILRSLFNPKPQGK
jgi:hypothetical protein